MCPPDQEDATASGGPAREEGGERCAAWVLSVILRSQAMVFGARVLLSLDMGSDPAFGANIDPEYRSGTQDGVSTGKHQPPQSILFM